MIVNQIVENSQWVWHIGISAIILWAVFIWKEWLNFGKPKFYINVIISFIAIFSISLLLLKPLTPKSKKQYNIALLTTEYNPNQLDSLKNVHNKLKIYNYSDNQPIIENTDYPDSVFILGHGLKPFDLWQLDAYKTAYLGGNVLNGISELKYNTTNIVGAQAIFNGRYLNATPGHRLILKSPGGEALDSITLLLKKSQDFQLTANLKVKGKFLFELVEKDSLGNSITTDPLPVNVSEQNQLKIVIINDFPTFETKYLKNFLAEKGHEVLIRSQLTKERFKFEYFNMTNRPMIDFSQENLSSFDLIIIDAISLRKFSKKQKDALETSIRVNGIGVFIQGDNSYYKSPNNLFSFKFIPDKNIITSLNKWQRVKMGTHAYRFKNEFNLQSIFQNKTRVLSAYKRVGLGRVGASVFQNTYEALLNGHTQAYQQLWTKTIESLSKIENPLMEWNTKALFAFKNEPFNFQLRIAETNPIVIANEGYNIPMRQDIDIATLWKGSTYPRDIGWKKQYIKRDTTAVFEYYTTTSQHWQTLIAYNTITINKRFFNNHTLKDHKSVKPMRPINSIWFFLIFIISMGYLWLESKL